MKICWNRLITLFRLQFACVEGVVTTVADIFPNLIHRKRGRETLSAGVCAILLLLGLPLLSNVRKKFVVLFVAVFACL